MESHKQYADYVEYFGAWAESHEGKSLRLRVWRVVMLSWPVSVTLRVVAHFVDEAE